MGILGTALLLTAKVLSMEGSVRDLTERLRAKRGFGNLLLVKLSLITQQLMLQLICSVVKLIAKDCIVYLR